MTPQTALIKTTPQSLQKIGNSLAITEKLLEGDIFEDAFYEKLLDKKNVEFAIELALNARLELDWYYDPFDLDIIQILESEDAKKEWKDNLTEKILQRIASKDLSFQVNFRFEFPKNNFENRSTLYTPFEDYVIRYLLGTIIFEFKDELLNDKSINYNDDIFSLIKTPEAQRPPAKFIQWQEDIFFNGDYQFMAHFDIKSFFASVSHEFLLEIISKKIGLNTNSFFYYLLKSALLIREIQENIIIEKDCGLVIQAIDRFFSDIFLESIDDIFSDYDDNILYQRKMDDVIILFNNASKYPKIASKIENGLKKLGLSLNHEKTKLYDKIEIGSDIESFYLTFKAEFSDFTYNFDCLIDLSINNNYKNGKGSRNIILQEKVLKRDEISRYYKIQNFEEKRIHLTKIDCDFVALLDSSKIKQLSHSKLEYIFQLLLSNISTEMKVKIIKEHYDKLPYTFNPYFQYVILRCIIQDFAINRRGQLELALRSSLLKSENKLLKSVVDYISSKY